MKTRKLFFKQPVTIIMEAGLDFPALREIALGVRK